MTNGYQWDKMVNKYFTFLKPYLLFMLRRDIFQNKDWVRVGSIESI